jgi:hypothetical protein
MTDAAFAGARVVAGLIPGIQTVPTAHDRSFVAYPRGLSDTLAQESG